MLEILKYTFSGFWTFIGCYAIVACILYFTANIIVRFFRLIQILFRGWPPNHLDGDGDFNDEKPRN